METLVEELNDAPPPADALACFQDLPYPLLLESAGEDPQVDRYSFLMADPFDLVRATVDQSSPSSPSQGDTDLFGQLREVLQKFREPTIAGIPPFQGGAAGYFGYDLCRTLERLPSHRHNDLLLPDLVVGLYDWTIAWDHETSRCWILSTGLPAHGSNRRDRATARAVSIGERLQRTRHRERIQTAARDIQILPSHPVPGIEAVSSSFTREEYIQTVARVREYILSGDIFQANLSQRLQAPSSVAPLTLYRALRKRSPSPYAAFFDIGDAAIVSASPELFLRLRGRSVETRPIKGTAPRSNDSSEDARRASDLSGSEKDRAENVMIVDLLRNDLSIVCRDESVQVPRLCGLESHGPVHHLVSTVTGELRQGYDAIDLLRACFPGGSITGAPKIRAMEIIAELEPTQRGPYTGSIGYIGFDGAMETSIVIRTFVVTSGIAFFQVGGGIVADSNPEREYQETLDKAAGLLAVLEDPG
ncbi:aminodeoxychorismate synthase component I [soil metagenome]